MKPIQKNLRTRLNPFASSPIFTKGVTPNQLYSELCRIVRNLIVAQDDLAGYLARYPEGTDAAKARLKFIEHSLEMELVKLWGFLGKQGLRPLNRRRGVVWNHWRSFLREAKQDESVLNHLEPVRDIEHDREEFVALPLQ